VELCAPADHGLTILGRDPASVDGSNVRELPVELTLAHKHRKHTNLPDRHIFFGELSACQSFSR
jgi:hypothetical protein